MDVRLRAVRASSTRLHPGARPATERVRSSAFIINRMRPAHPPVQRVKGGDSRLADGTGARCPTCWRAGVRLGTHVRDVVSCVVAGLVGGPPRSAAMTPDDVMAQLEKYGSAQTRKTYARHG